MIICILYYIILYCHLINLICAGGNEALLHHKIKQSDLIKIKKDENKVIVIRPVPRVQFFSC